MPLRILSGKGAVQIMPFQKLGGKCHFLLWFCTRKRSETYSLADPRWGAREARPLSLLISCSFLQKSCQIINKFMSQTHCLAHCLGNSGSTTDVILLNMKLYISGCNRIVFQANILHWSCSFLMAQLKRSYQHWRSCIVESL